MVISVNGRSVNIEKRTITYQDVERIVLLHQPSVTYRFTKTGAKGILFDGDHLAVASDLEVFAVVTGAS